MGRLVDTRLPGWEERLAAVFESARDTPYDLGRHDCLRVACQAFEALTGRDYWAEFAGRYSSKIEALRVIRSLGQDFAAAITAVTGLPTASPLMARRGDPVLYRDPGGEDHLGVCNGAHVGVLGRDGLQWLALDDPGLLMAWRVE
jgi:hypothetical protein